jgi:hypothetical protein
LLGWDLRLAEASGPRAVGDFSYVVDAIPHDLPLHPDAIERLCNQVFLLLGLIAGQEIGVAPVVGVDAAGRVVWADWGAPGFRPEQSAWRWCPKHSVSHALPVLAIGLTSLANDPALQQVVDRASRHLLAANGPEVLEVRIPVACTGLELLGWAVLQRHQWLTRDGLGKLPAGGLVRLLLQWAGIPVELPTPFLELEARRVRLGQADAAGPELIFPVRNSLVHPPKRIEDPERPHRDELLEAWQLATWYLELAFCDNYVEATLWRSCMGETGGASPVSSWPSSSSRVGSRRRDSRACKGSPAAAWRSPPFRWLAGVGTVRGAPPGGRAGGHVGTGRVGLALQQPDQIGFQSLQAVELGADLGEAFAQEGLGVAAGTLALVGDLEQLADLA